MAYHRRPRQRIDLCWNRIDSYDGAMFEQIGSVRLGHHGCVGGPKHGSSGIYRHDTLEFNPPIFKCEVDNDMVGNIGRNRLDIWPRCTLRHSSE